MTTAKGSEQRTQTFTCEETGRQFEAEQFMFAGEWFPTHRLHPDIVEEREQQERQQERQRKQQERSAALLKLWEQQCPPIMKDTDLARLDATGVDKVLGWQPKERGLVLHGVTGRGKTRLMWQKIKQVSLEGLGWRFYHARKLADALSESWDSKGHEKIMRACNQCRLLFIDDLGKEKVTARWETELFDIVNTRTEQALPTIISTNYRGDPLVAKFADAELGAALLRRLREFFDTINL
jgi:DNA replication protein DnaC